jgi:hypothetical protein
MGATPAPCEHQRAGVAMCGGDRPELHADDHGEYRKRQGCIDYQRSGHHSAFPVSQKAEPGGEDDRQNSVGRT